MRNRLTFSRGFTLLEVIIVAAIVAILAAVAIPSYGEYVRRANLADAQKAMAGSTVDLEQIFADRRAYPAAAGFTPKSTTEIAVAYTPAADGRSYVLSGVGSGNMAGYYLTISARDAKCKCEKCGSNPMASMVGTDSTCPTGSVPW